MVDDGESAVRRLNDIRDVVRAIAVAARLLDEHLELLEADVLDLMRQAANKQSFRLPMLTGCMNRQADCWRQFCSEMLQGLTIRNLA
jgi:hypothetical protein